MQALISILSLSFEAAAQEAWLSQSFVDWMEMLSCLLADEYLLVPFMGGRLGLGGYSLLIEAFPFWAQVMLRIFISGEAMVKSCPDPILHFLN